MKSHKTAQRKGQEELGYTEQNKGKYVRLQVQLHTNTNRTFHSVKHTKEGAFGFITEKGGCLRCEQTGEDKIGERHRHSNLALILWSTGRWRWLGKHKLLVDLEQESPLLKQVPRPRDTDLLEQRNPESNSCSGFKDELNLTEKHSGMDLFLSVLEETWQGQKKQAKQTKKENKLVMSDINQLLISDTVINQYWCMCLWN